ncbi:hypothetical protein O7632_17140 [Solwaraspora sp. WMMD406]|uniref:hypothetical protein n=1 Tax=Solwaraspora sp. WMMD406 TaxID=3016095 RepID=UPI0024177065|nr:hypothetical protein [Solwaraspora sp. WMMD406]MDG4765811.1 hypothetical protein [Solwaraspora sp. WMMD406]
MAGGRAVRLLTVVLLTAGTAVAPADPATAVGRSGFCPDDNGVTVVVDFQELGGPTIVRCAVGDQATGHAALKNAGISITGTARWGESFVCRIEGKPTVAEEPCVDTPPANAYWSYWHASNGGAWTYSQRGVTARKPPPGSFEGWSFSKNRTASTSPSPGVAPVRPVPQPPPSTPAPPPPPPPPPSRTTLPPPPNPSPTTPTTPTRGQPGSSQNGPEPGQPATTRPGMSTPSRNVTTTPSGSSTTASAAAPDPTVPSAATDSSARGEAWTGDVDPVSGQRSGLPTMTVVGVGLLLLVTVAAVVTARRRGRSG